jgi:hypothetical protein
MPAGARVLLCAAVVAALGCNIDNPGDAPPRGLLYFPNAIALSKHADGEAPRYLFVANSDFDLRYNAGSVQAFSLERLAAKVAACGGKPTCAIDPIKDGIFEDEVWVGPFSTSLALSADGSYLFAATRTESALDFIHVDASASGDAVLSCNKGELRCGLHAAPAIDRSKDTKQTLAWPSDPEAIISGPLADWLPPGSGVQGDYVLTAHIGGQLSLFVLQPDQRGTAQELVMTDVLSGQLPGALTRLAYDPVTKLIYLTVATSASGKLLERVGIAIPESADGVPDPSHALVYNAGALFLSAVGSFSDTRDVTFIPAIPESGTALAEDRALVVSRAPSALLVVDANQERNPPDSARVDRTAVVGPGASRVAVGLFPGRPLAVVGSFDSRELSVIDLTTMLTRAVIPNLSGPYALVIDEPRKLLYVGDFRSSVIRVIDLAPLLEPVADPEIRVIATLGHPRVLQELR